jgi:hypothetical protein
MTSARSVGMNFKSASISLSNWLCVSPRSRNSILSKLLAAIASWLSSLSRPLNRKVCAAKASSPPARMR